MFVARGKALSWMTWDPGWNSSSDYPCDGHRGHCRTLAAWTMIDETAEYCWEVFGCQYVLSTCSSIFNFRGLNESNYASACNHEMMSPGLCKPPKWAPKGHQDLRVAFHSWVASQRCHFARWQWMSCGRSNVCDGFWRLIPCRSCCRKIRQTQELQLGQNMPAKAVRDVVETTQSLMVQNEEPW